MSARSMSVIGFMQNIAADTGIVAVLDGENTLPKSVRGDFGIFRFCIRLSKAATIVARITTSAGNVAMTLGTVAANEMKEFSFVWSRKLNGDPATYDVEYTGAVGAQVGWFSLDEEPLDSVG